jgi:release factor glutamine methyltransferase
VLRRDANNSSPALDAELLLAFVLRGDRTWLAAHSENRVTSAAQKQYRKLIAKRRRGEPLAYLLGTQSFFGRDFRVGPGVLIPRADSEILVEEALRLFPKASSLAMADIGSGSGCLGLSILAERPRAKLWAVDKSPSALTFTRRNARELRLTKRCRVVRGDLLQPLPSKRFDLIVANLPYLTPKEIRTEVSIQHEPRLALDGGRDGLTLYRRFFRQLALRSDQPTVLLEIDPRRKTALARLARQLLPTYTQSWSRDLGGHWRLLRLSSSGRSSG